MRRSIALFVGLIWVGMGPSPAAAQDADLATLAAQDLMENTLVLFFSDNGGRSPWGDNGGLRGSKGMLYEGGIREPMIAHWPGTVARGSRCTEAVIGLDLYPTFMDLAGVERDSKQQLDGLSLVPCLRGEPLEKREGLKLKRMI